jgi:heterodisulfide reductase subunit D
MGKNTWLVNAFIKMKFPLKVKFIRGFTGAAKKYYRVPRAAAPHVEMKQLVKCGLCPNMCRFECPALRVTHKEMYAPATKTRISYHMERGHISWDDPHSAEVPYLCTNCDGCRYWCPMDISAGELLKAVRADIVENGFVNQDLVVFNDRVLKNRTTFESDTFTRDPALDVNMEGADVIYFPGCVMVEKKPESVRATIAILKQAGVQFCMHMDIRGCCGGPLNTVGFLASVKEFARKNLAMFKEAGVKTIVTDCPACAETIAIVYPRLGIKHKFEVLTTTQYFAMLHAAGKLPFTVPVDMTITYHDPCITARRLDDVETVRKIFAEIPGLELHEAFLHGKETQCCGMGGVEHVHHPAVSEAIGSQRLAQLQKVAPLLVTSCPACEEGFMIAGGTHEQVLDIAEIVAKAAGVKMD